MADSDKEMTWTPPVKQVPAIRRLTNSREVRRLLARLASHLWSGDIDPKTANAITYTLATAARVINDEQTLALARRIAALEERIAGRPGLVPVGRSNGRRFHA